VNANQQATIEFLAVMATLIFMAFVIKGTFPFFERKLKRAKDWGFIDDGVR
jgi:hypothetical protein